MELIGYIGLAVAVFIPLLAVVGAVILVATYITAEPEKPATYEEAVRKGGQGAYYAHLGE